MKLKKLSLCALVSLVTVSTAGFATDVCTTEGLAQGSAQTVCDGVCSAEKMTWNGQWTTQPLPGTTCFDLANPEEACGCYATTTTTAESKLTTQ
jgi:hypothetical protein